MPRESGSRSSGHESETKAVSFTVYFKKYIALNRGIGTYFRVALRGDEMFLSWHCRDDPRYSVTVTPPRQSHSKCERFFFPSMSSLVAATGESRPNGHGLFNDCSVQFQRQCTLRNAETRKESVNSWKAAITTKFTCPRN